MSPRLRFVIRRTAVMIPVLIAMSIFVVLIIRPLRDLNSVNSDAPRVAVFGDSTAGDRAG